MNMANGTAIRVKLLYKLPTAHLRKQLPRAEAVWGKCQFLFDPDEREYDWLVVYDDLPASNTERRTLREEVLACPAQHTMLVTTEPSSIKTYGQSYVSQFGCVLTSQEDWALSHPDRIYSQAANHWIYGSGNTQVIDLDRLQEMPPPEKSGLISIVWSNKSQRHTIHWKRNAFMKKIRDAMPELQVFGRGIRPMDDKAESIDSFKYHIAIENYVGIHHWTEKLSDAFLGYSLPFYYGCSNITDYFPAQSLIIVDIEQFDQTLEIIRNAIRNNEYEKRLPYIIDARKLVIEKYNIFAVVSREIEKRHRPDIHAAGNQVLKSRHTLRKKNPLLVLRQGYEKARNTLIHTVKSHR
jgi:hypothetical protein